MPLLKIHFACELKKEVFNSLSNSLTKSIAEILSKSEDFVVVIFQRTEFQSFGLDSVQPSLYLEFKNVGTLRPDDTRQLTSCITGLCAQLIEVQANRIYIEYQECQRHHWGWSGKTFF